jgi:nucleoside-diphosphate-sugar epimerase
MLLGASGQIGLFALARLVGAGFRVLAVSRQPRPGWFPEFPAVQWLRAGTLGPGMEVNYLLSAGPVEVATNLVTDCQGLERAVVFSTSSVYSKAESADRQEKQLVQSIRVQELALATVCKARGVKLCLYRPTLIYGCGLDANVSLLADWIRRFGLMPVAGAASGLRQPVHADDLARTAVNTLLLENALSLDEPLCGGETLEYREMVARVFDALHCPQKIINLPAGLLAAVVTVARLLPAFRGLRAEMVRRQNRDLVYDDSTARRLAGHQARTFQLTQADLSLPTAEILVRLAEPGQFEDNLR